MKQSSVIVINDILEHANAALDAFSMLLGDDDWFFSAKKPSLFDASVFAYTQLLLDDTVAWDNAPGSLTQLVRSKTNLVSHRNRILQQYFSSDVVRP